MNARSDRLVIAVAQLNPVVGDVSGNADKARRARKQAAGADLVVFSELFIAGYPPEDLVLKPAFQAACRSAIEALARETADGGPALIIGTPWVEAGKTYNAACLLSGGRIPAVRFKVDLPNTGVFTNPSGTIPISGTANFNIDWFGTVHGRVGVMADNWMLFGTAGLAYGHASYSLSATETGGLALFQTALSASEMKYGYVVGAGVEYAFAPNLNLKGEYQYINLGTIGATGPVTPLGGGAPTGETATLKAIDAAFHTLRLGLNWKL